MRKLFTLLMALVATLSLFAGNTITYTATAKLIETTYSNSSGFLPHAFDASITSHTFSNGTGTITFSGEITLIGDSAFNACTGLTSITIPNSVTEIGDYAFSGCTDLTSVTIPNSVTWIGMGVFQGCTGLTSVTIPNSVTSIGDWAFYGCTGLTSVTIGNSVTSIGQQAFYGCTGLTSVTIGNSVTSIGNWAFYGCTGLTSVTIPNSVTEIGWDAFRDVSNIVYTGIAIGSPWGAKCVNGYAEGFLVYSDSTKTNLLVCSTSATGSITIPSSVTSIGNDAFRYCTGLTSVTIPESVTTIGSSAFSGCTGLPIENNLRYADTYLIEAVNKSQVTYSIKEGTRWIGDRAFYNCSKLKSITIPDSVTSIGKEVFYMCSRLTSITIGKSVTSINESAFFECTSLTSITIKSNSILNTGSRVYLGGGPQTTEYIIGEGVTSIGASAFSGTWYMTSVTIPEGVTSIGNDAFNGCTGLTSVTIPSSVTTIGDYAFYACTALTSVTIPNSVTSIGSNAFKNILNIVYTGTATGSPWGAKYVNKYVEGFWVYSDSTKTNLLRCSTSATGSITIPSSVTSIGDSAFYNCKNITSITIPEGVTSIGKHAFYTCEGLTSVTIPNSVTSIGDYSFYKCWSLTSVTIPDGVTTIGDYAFRNCTSLTSVTIPNSVTTIGSYAFEGCTKLTSVTIGSGVTTIGSYAFNGCTGMTSVTIPNSVTKIGSSAFSGCTATIYMPCGFASRYASAFSYRNTLREINSDFTVTYNDVNTDQGAVSLSALQCDYTVTLTSTAKTGLFFDQWSDGNVDNPRTVTVASDTIIPFYAQYTNLCTVNVLPNIEGAGVVSDRTKVTPGSTVTLSASANYGYDFLYWSDGNMDTIRTIVVNDNITLTAIFQLHYFIADIRPQDPQMMETSSVMIPYMETGSIEAQPLYGYHFVQWTDGVTDNPRSVTLTSDSVFVAVCAPNNYTIYTEVPNGHGSITGAGTYPYNTMITLTAVPDKGYKLKAWSDGSTENPRTIRVDGDMFIGAEFEMGYYNITVQTNDFSMGVAYGSGLQISGNEAICTASANPGYHFVMWDNGEARNPYGCTVTSDTTIMAIFAANQQAGGNVSVLASDSTAAVAWPTVTGAETYTLVIWKDNTESERICTLTFSSTGQLISIDFSQGSGAAPRRAPSQTAVGGLNFTVTGLQTASPYKLALLSKDVQKEIVDIKECTFHTNGYSVLEDVDATSSVEKFIRDGQLYIRRNGQLFDATGRLVE